MNKHPIRAVFLFASLLACWSGLAHAIEPPAVSNRIPDDAAFALFLQRPGDALPRIGAVVDRFKNVHPDMDWSKVGEKVKGEIGENILTAEGQRAFGLDPDGTLAIYSSGFEGEPTVVLPVSNAKLFVDRMFAVAEKNGTKFDRKPQKRAGARVYKVAGDEFAIDDKWCLIYPQPAKPGDPVKAFFGRGKKLAADKDFKSSLAALPPEADGIAYLAMAAAGKGYAQSADDMIARWAADMKNAPADRQKWMKTSLDDMKRVREGFSALLGKFKGLAGGFRVEAQRLSGSVYLATRPAGAKHLAQIFPGTSGQPSFHGDLLKRSIAGGWASMKTLPMMDLAGGLPTSPYRSLDRELEQASKAFQQTFQMDLRKDLLGNLRDPVAAYFFSPDLSKLNTKAPMEDQIVPLFQFVSLVRVGDVSKASGFLAKLDELARTSGKPFEQVQVGNARISKIRPKASVALNWALVEDVLVFGFGENTVERALEKVDPGRWTKPERAADRGLAAMDLAALGETISSAVSKGIGGDSGMQFRMTWPLFQQVLARFGKLSMRGQMVGGGAILHSELSLH